MPETMMDVPIQAGNAIDFVLRVGEFAVETFTPGSVPESEKVIPPVYPIPEAPVVEEAPIESGTNETAQLADVRAELASISSDAPVSAIDSSPGE